MAKELTYNRTGFGLPPRSVRRRRLLLLVPLAIILLIFFFAVIGSVTKGREQRTKDYLSHTNTITEESNQVSKKFGQLLRSASLSSQSQFKSSLMELVQESQDIRQQAEILEPPDDFKVANGFLMISMRLRNEGLEKYQSSIMSTISSTTVISDGEISSALKGLALSDLAYDNFTKEAQALLKEGNLSFKLEGSKFLTDDAVYEKQNVSDFLKRLKGQAPPLPQSDVYISDVATNPLRLSYDEKTDVRTLPSTDVVAVKIAAGNKGAAQSKVPVEVELFVKGDSISKETSTVTIKSNQITKITIPGFSPVKGKVNTFKIKVGPVVGETNTNNNFYEYKFIVK